MKLLQKIASCGARFHPSPLSSSLHLEWTEPPFAGLKLPKPSLESLKRMFDWIYKMMKGRTIQSSRIENVNREIKTVIPDWGIKSPEQAIKLFDHHLTYWSDQPAMPRENIAIINSVSR